MWQAVVAARSYPPQLTVMRVGKDGAWFAVKSQPPEVIGRLAVYPPIATNNPVESHERLIFVTPNLTLRKIWKSSAMDSDV